MMNKRDKAKVVLEEDFPQPGNPKIIIKSLFIYYKASADYLTIDRPINECL